MQSYRWRDYLICLAPLGLLAYLGLESYGIDYRAFYLAGKSALASLNPYLNYVNENPDYYGPINSELSLYSGWKYPPIVAYLFSPLALINYEISKNLFNLVTLIVLAIAARFAIIKSNHTIPSESILIVLISFPMLATIERGQIDFLLMALTAYSAYLFSKDGVAKSGFLLALISCIKIFPLLLLLGYSPGIPKGRKALIATTSTLAALAIITLIACRHDWITSFIERSMVPFDSMPQGSFNHLPKDIGIIDGTNVVQTSDSRNLIFTHDFTNGFGNPLLLRYPSACLIVGVTGSILSLRMNRNSSTLNSIFAIMPWINIINPISWIMGLAWYVPYFLNSYRQAGATFRFILCLPLILPPMLNASAYIAASLTLVGCIFIPSLNSKKH